MSLKILKALADRSRLAIVRALLDGPSYVERLAAQTQLAPSTVSFHLRKLYKANLVTSQREQYYVVYSLRSEVLEQPLKELIDVDTPETELARRRGDRYREQIRSRFLVYGKLKSIPVQRKKRRVILEALLEEFEAGRRYPEREVNVILSRFHEDFCTLRREMICEKLMEREDGVYRVREDAGEPAE